MAWDYTNHPFEPDPNKGGIYCKECAGTQAGVQHAVPSSRVLVDYAEDDSLGADILTDTAKVESIDEENGTVTVLIDGDSRLTVVQREDIVRVLHIAVQLTPFQYDEVEHLLAVVDDTRNNGEDPDRIVWGRLEGRTLIVLDPTEAAEELRYRADHLINEAAVVGKSGSSQAASLRKLAAQILKEGQ